MDHPVEKPVSNLPTKMTPRKALDELARLEYVIMSQPASAGTPPSMRAACRPNSSDMGQATSPPNIAPMGPNAYNFEKGY